MRFYVQEILVTGTDRESSRESLEIFTVRKKEVQYPLFSLRVPPIHRTGSSVSNLHRLDPKSRVRHEILWHVVTKEKVFTSSPCNYPPSPDATQEPWGKLRDPTVNNKLRDQTCICLFSTRTSEIWDSGTRIEEKGKGKSESRVLYTLIIKCPYVL